MRSYLLAFGALLGLTAVNVAISRAALGTAFTMAAVLTVAGLEAVLAAIVFMHLGRERRWVYGAVILTLVVLVGLLFWPAWDIYERPRL